MKVIIASDFHLDHSTQGVSRYEEIREGLEQTVDKAIEEEAAAYVFAGDLCDPDAGSCVFRCVAAIVSAAVRLADRGIYSIWLAGNHDVIEDGTGCTTLTPLRALSDCERLNGKVQVIEQPSRVEITARGAPNDVRYVLGLPFAATSHAYDVSAIIDELAPKENREKTMIVGHLNVPGVVPGEETTDMPRGREVWLPTDLAHERAKIVVNGHYHRQHRTETGVWIPGSLARLTFGEEGNAPGYLMVEL